MEISRSASAKSFHFYSLQINNPAQKLIQITYSHTLAENQVTTEVYPFITTSKEDATVGTGHTREAWSRSFERSILHQEGRFCHQKAVKKLEKP